MNDIKQDLRAGFENAVADLKTMRDEIRLKIHLGSMEAKDRWTKLEPGLSNLEDQMEKGGSAVWDTLKTTAEELRTGFTTLRDDLRSK